MDLESIDSMYEKYTRQALPLKEYRELLGSAICTFNSNNAFIIENILRIDNNECYSWHNLIDFTSGKLKSPLERTITSKAGPEIAELFNKLVEKRNRIVHSFQITDQDGLQKLATKDSRGFQFVITEKYLLVFIKENEELSSRLHQLRGF